MITPKLKKSVWVVLTAAALTACGGGGGGSSSSSDSDDSSQPLVVGMKDKSEYADQFDATINNFTCFKGENNDKCGLILYQVMVEAAPNGGGDDAAGKGTGWGPSEHKGTLKGIQKSLEFIKGSGANALWITPVFTTSSGTGDEKTNATGYFASEIWKNGKPSIDPAFGDLDSFQSLVNATHAPEIDMLFILDGVFGHARSDFDSTLALDDYTHYTPYKFDTCLTMSGDEKSKTDKEVYGSAGSNFTCFKWDESGTKNFFESLAQKMITEYGIDGWRLDQAYQVPNGDWLNISNTVKYAAAETTDRHGAGYMVAEVWSGNPEDIEKTVFKNAAVESAFNFPLRYKLVQVLAGQEDASSDEATGREASFIANPWGYGSMATYTNYNVMPNMFTDNHDLVRFGNLLFRHNILDIKSAEPLLEDDVGVPEYSQRHLLAFAFMMEYSGPITIYYGSEYGYGSFAKYTSYDVMPNTFTDNHDLVRFGNLLFRHDILDIKSAEPLLKDDVGVPEYSLRHLLAFAFMMEYSGPITIYYGSEYGDWTEGFSKKLDPCGTGKKWCDDHASRTQMVSSEDKLKQWQKDLRTNVGKMMEYRKKHPALYNGNRFHIYSTTKKPSDRDSANFYVDVKKAADGSEAFVFVASMSRKDRTLQFDDEMAKYLCQKAKGADSCDLDLVMDTSKPDVMSTVQDSSKFAFEMPALSARLYKVE